MWTKTDKSIEIYYTGYHKQYNYLITVAIFSLSLLVCNLAFGNICQSNHDSSQHTRESRDISLFKIVAFFTGCDVEVSRSKLMKKSQILYPFRLDEWTLSLLLHQISLFLYHINWEKEKVVCDFANMSKKHFVINLNISGDVTRLPDSETMREQLREIFSISDIKSQCWELRAALATSFCQVLM